MPTEVFRRRALRSAAFLIAFLLFLSLSFVISYVSAPVFADRRTASTKAEIVAGQPPERSQPARSATNAALLNLPLSFEPADKANQFLVRGGGYRLLLAPSVTTIALKGQDGERLVRMELAGANAQAEGLELCELPGKRNYLIGNDSSKCASMCQPTRRSATKKFIQESVSRITATRAGLNTISWLRPALTRDKSVSSSIAESGRTFHRMAILSCVSRVARSFNASPRSIRKPAASAV